MDRPVIFVATILALLCVSGIFTCHLQKPLILWLTLVFSVFNLVLWFLFYHRSWFSNVQTRQQVPPHNLAGIFVWRQHGAPRFHRLCSQEWQIQDHLGAQIMVRSDVGSNPLCRRRFREVFLRHRRLWLREGGVRWRQRRTAGDFGGVHVERRPRFGLLRRELGWWVQSPHAGGGKGWPRWWLQRHRVSRRPERRVPEGAEGGGFGDERQPRRECRV